MVTYEEFDKFDRLGIPDGYIRLRQERMDIGGGRITYSDIDKIDQYADTGKIAVSGLTQDTFEYFIKKHGHKLRDINFFKNKLVEDFSALSGLPDIRLIKFFHNQRAVKLWDMSGNYSLEGLAFSDFSRLRTIDGVQKAPNLKHLFFGDAIWLTSVLNDINPLAGTKLISFCFNGKNIIDRDLTVYAKMPELRILHFPTNMYTTEEIAQIAALCPHVTGYALRPCIRFDSGEKDVLICGKRKPFLNSVKDAARIKAYEDKYCALVEKYKNAAAR